MIYDLMEKKTYWTSRDWKQTFICKILLCLLTFLMLLTVSSCHMSYARPLSQTCFPRDSCYGASTAVSKERNCQCDEHCSYYNDCCWDAYRQYRARHSDSLMKCHQISLSQGYYAISYCQKRWKDRYIRKKCQDKADITDPLTSLPVTSAKTSITYQNYYCAICNEDSTELTFWLTLLECPTLFSDIKEKELITAYVRQHLTYNPYCRKWGVRLHGTFHSCRMDLKPPDNYEDDTLRPCFPNTTSRCSSTWRNERIKQKCESYTATVFNQHEQGSYRNVYCAICNYVNVALLSCNPPHEGTYFRASSLTILLDVRNSECKEGEFYDPFFKKCRNFVCGFANRVLVNGKCIRIG